MPTYIVNTSMMLPPYLYTVYLGNGFLWIILGNRLCHDGIAMRIGQHILDSRTRSDQCVEELPDVIFTII